MNQTELIRFGTGRQLTEIDYLSELLSYQTIFQPIKSVNQLIEQVSQTIDAINQGFLPAQLSTLEVSDSMILDVQRYVVDKFPSQPAKGNALWGKLSESLEAVDFLVRHLRDALIEYFSMYGYVSTPFIQDLSTYLAGKPVLELMAGHGYLSAGLRSLNPDQVIISTDSQLWREQPDITLDQPVTAVENMTGIAALEKYGQEVAVIIMSWAPDTSTADWELLQVIRKNYSVKKMLVIGEYQGATNSKVFWQQAKLKPVLATHHHTFDLIDEQVYEVE
ncbi:MAG: SAM-dependent methyltransferase [Weissella hellenica]|uniref:SAM-dependent methyltransferase n=1 Tax=Weissella hellenica TaxID=46256 RepID=UPI003F95E6B4